MARGVNKVILVGNLGKDPDVRYTTSGAAVASFSIATSESWKDKNTGEKQERTEWHNVTAFNKLTEIIGEYVKKGSQIYIEGSLRTEKYQDKKTGEDRYSTKIIANNIQMLGGRGDNEQSQSNNTARQGDNQHAAAGDDFSDDIPFNSYLKEWI